MGDAVTELEPLCTPAEVSLGQVLDALPDDSPWLRELELADEDWGRPIGDYLRMLRWCRALVHIHFAHLSWQAQRDLAARYFDATWPVYRQHLHDLNVMRRRLLLEVKA